MSLSTTFDELNDEIEAAAKKWDVLYGFSADRLYQFMVIQDTSNL